MRRAPLAALVAIVALAFVVRVHDADVRTLTHPESYVPHLDFREPFDSPAPRRTLWETIQRTIDDDNHPPAQLVLMYGWNSLFGTGLFAMRFPSVVLGTLGVALVFLLGRRLDDWRTAALAAALLALNGEHVFWSQHARIWVMVSTIAIASTWLLARLEREPTPAKALGFVALVALGLWTEYYFWIYFLGLGVWLAARGARSGRLPVATRYLASALVLATPMAVFLHPHLTLRRHFVEPKTWPRLVEVFAGNGLSDKGLVERWLPGTGDVGMLVLAFAVGAVLLRGLSVAPRSPETADESPAPPSLRGLIVGSAFAAELTLAAMFLADLAKPAWIAAAAALPPVGVAGWRLIERLWPAARLQDLARTRALRFLARDPVTTTFAVTLVLLVLVSAAKPMLLARGLLILAPLAAIVIARGALSLGEPLPRIAVPMLLLLGAASAHDARIEANARADFQTLGRAIDERAADGEIVALQNRWFAQPVLYYLDLDRTPATTPEEVLRRAESGRGPAAFWLVVFGVDDDKLAENQRDAIAPFLEAGYRETERTLAMGTSALRLTRSR